ncbi:MAG: glycosyltransferase family 4 protein [Candidatus Omnitrophica bacterium]|nr:glycosyltransferase family 4 protein [Candidatus Omnitrophota bacterium]
MRVVQLTPGTGNFYCGACVRDNALAHELNALGCETLTVPLYLPMVTDEPADDGMQPILFGGLNVYLQEKIALFRHTPRWLDKLFDNPKLLRKLSDRAGMTSAKELGEMTLSSLKGMDGKQAKEIRHLVDWLKEYGHPDIVLLSNCLLSGLAKQIKAELGVPVLNTLQGEDGYLDSLGDPYSDQCWSALRHVANDVDLFIAVSPYYGETMKSRMSLPDHKVVAVYNGIKLDGYGPSHRPDNPPVLGYFARLYPAKGLDQLVDTFIRLKERKSIPGLKLKAGGTATPSDEKFIREQKMKLDAAGFLQDAEFVENLSHEDKIEFLKSLTVLSVPTAYAESFGLYVVEALASGVPVVQPAEGAFPDLIKETGGGLLFKPRDTEDHADTLEKLLSNVTLAQEMGERGRLAVNEKFTVRKMAEGMIEVFERVSAPGDHSIQAAAGV